MAMIETVSGPMAEDQLGITQLTEHVLLTMPGWEHAPDTGFNKATAFDQAAKALIEFHELGGRTIVDVGGITFGRDVAFLQDLSRVSGVNIIVTTGFPSYLAMPGHFEPELGRMYCEPSRWQWRNEVPGSFFSHNGGRIEYFTTLFFNELSVGLATPGMIRMYKLAGAVVAGIGSSERLTSWHQGEGADASSDPRRLEEMTTRAALQAARRAGRAALLSDATFGERLLRVCEEEGFPTDRLILGHADNGATASLERDRQLAEHGAYVAYDHVGWEEGVPDAMPDKKRVELVKGMVDAGLSERVVLSCSAAACVVGWPSTSHSFSHLLKNFIPALRDAGIGDDTIHTMLVENPARLLAGE